MSSQRVLLDGLHRLDAKLLSAMLLDALLMDAAVCLLVVAGVGVLPKRCGPLDLSLLGYSKLLLIDG